MEPVEAAFIYGPVTFIGLSCVSSVPLAKRLALRFGRPRPPGETFSERPALGARAISLLAALSLIWSVATAVGFVALALPDPRGPATELRLDAALLVHAIPPLSARAATRIADELRRADGVTRFSPPGELERHLVAAARIDPQPERSVAALAAQGFRTHAGRFALASSSLATCDQGLDALAEAMQGSALQDLMVRCRNAPGDAVGFAAFKMGDFQRGVGPEAESIISRQPRSPVDEPSCFAGGFETPPASQPICRLIHAEMVDKTRAEIYATPIAAPRFARLWWEAARAPKGAGMPAGARYGVDPELLLRRPHAALRDEPLAIHMLHARQSLDDRGARIWSSLVFAAAMSERADRTTAAKLAFQAAGSARLLAEDDPERAAAGRLALAIAIRAGDDALASATAELLPAGDPLVARADWGIGVPVSDDEPEWVRLVAAQAPGAAIADALHRAGDGAEDLGRLGAVSEEERDPLREWLREDFPACVRCDFADQLDRLTLRLDAARALDDDDLVERLDTVYRRYEAVVLNRVLSLSLRASQPP